MERVRRLASPVPLRPDHQVSDFDSGVPALDNWLKHRALKNESRFSRTYVACNGARVGAFYSMSAGAIERDSAPGMLRRNAPDPIPIVILGRLAVDKRLNGHGFGAGLLNDALRRIVLVSQTIGIAAILVHAKTEAAKKFYLASTEFVEFPVDSRTLFLPIETVVRMTGSKGPRGN